MPSAAPTPLRLQPDADPLGRLVLLHGWGADADDLLMPWPSNAAPLELVALPAPELIHRAWDVSGMASSPADWDAVTST